MSTEFAARREELFHARENVLHRRTDHVFVILMTVQWVACIAAALWLTPHTWAGTLSQPHVHLTSAIGLGALFAVPSIWGAIRAPGCLQTRLTIAVCQAMFSALIIHLSGGRIEAHFHVFGSLAFLAFYRDPRVLLLATAVFGADHFARGVFWPESVFGVADASNWRWLEHVAWVLFLDIFLLWSLVRGRGDMRSVAERQAQLEQTNAHIEEVVRQRTAELEEARDRALESTRLKSQFLANMSHEIRTPLNGVLGFSELLADTSLDQEQSAHVDTIRMSSDLLLDVVNDILDFSKIEAGHLDLEEIPVDLTDVVEGVGDLLAHAAAKNKIEFVCGVQGSEHGQVLGDPTRLRQILLNLTNNAIKFTHEGEVRLWGQVEAPKDGVVAARFSVQDTGIGIPEDKLHLLFDSFSQVDGSTTRQYGGTGLGLAITKKLTELMGGTVHVESVLGQGACFSVEFKFPEVANPLRALPDFRAIRSLRVLAIDDHPTNRTLLKEMLAFLDTPVTLLADPNEVVPTMRRAVADGTPFDVLLLDYLMPGRDGLDVARVIASAPELSHTRRVLATSVFHLDRTTLAESGLHDALIKPLKRSDLHRALGSKREESIVEPTESEGPRARILLAEDHVINQRLAQRMLEKQGYDVTIAKDGMEALEAVEHGGYDLLLMDIQMPRLDGIEATRRIRARTDIEQPIILALTANAMLSERVRCEEAGMDGFLTKPLRPKELYDTLARHLQAATTAVP